MAPRAVSTEQWQLACSEIQQRGAALLQSQQWADCEFLVGSGRVPIGAHKLLLAMASPVFEAMFYGGLAEKRRPIPIPDIEPGTFKLLLEYIYTDIININSCSVACDLYYGAQKYILPHLMAACSEHLTRNLDPHNVCRLYEFAQWHQDNALMDQTLKVIKTKTKEVLSADSFEDARLETVIAVFSMETLEIESELELVHAAERYANAQVSTGQEHQHITDAILASEPEATPSIRNAIQNIRFLTLSAQEFIENTAVTSLLTESEISAITANIISDEAREIMPNGFTTCRRPRKLPEEIDPEITFRATIHNIKDLDWKLYAGCFYLLGLPWNLQAYKEHSYKNDVQKCGLSVNLYSEIECFEYDGSFYPEVEIRVLRSGKPGTEPYCWSTNNGLSVDITTCWGCYNDTHLDWNELMDPKNGYLYDGAITLEVRLLCLNYFIG